MKTNETKHLSAMMMTCEQAHFAHWQTIKPQAENEFRGLLLMLDWIKDMKLKNAITTEQARIHIDIHKNTMRTRLMSLPDVSMTDAEHIINSAIDSIRKDIYDKLDWVII
jgi:hypothetical protein